MLSPFLHEIKQIENQINSNLLDAYLSKVTLAQDGQEVEILKTNLAGLVANLLAWLLLKGSINKMLSANSPFDSDRSTFV